jgi:hypothetical protein
MTLRTPTPFREELRSRVKKYRTRCLKGGTVGVGFQTLFGAVCGNGIHNLAGAPNGTNSAYYFKEELRRIVSDLGPEYVRFLLD